MSDLKEKREHRNEVFRVWIEPDKWSSFPDELEINYTKNGFQGQSFSLLPEEVEKFIVVFQDALDKLKGKK